MYRKHKTRQPAPLTVIQLINVSKINLKSPVNSSQPFVNEDKSNKSEKLSVY